MLVNDHDMQVNKIYIFLCILSFYYQIIYFHIGLQDLVKQNDIANVYYILIYICNKDILQIRLK